MAARARGRLPVTALLLAGFAVSSAGNLLTGLAWTVAAAFGVQAVRGLGIAALDVAATTLVQRTVPPGLLSRVFGTLYGGIGVAAAVAYLLGGLLLDRTGPRVAFVTAGAAGLQATGARVTTDPQRLTDERRYDVPATVIATEFTADMLRGWIDQGLAPVQELPRIRRVEYVDLPTGHWPQLTRPDDLARAILASIDRATGP